MRKIQNHGAALAFLCLCALAGYGVSHEVGQHEAAKTYNRNDEKHYKEDEQSASLPEQSRKNKRNEQADWREYILEKTTDWLLVIFNFALAVFTWRLWRSTEKLWQVTSQTVASAEKQFIAENRPWLSVSLKPADSLNIAQDGSVTCGMELTYCNHGPSPAINVLIDGPIVIYKDNDVVPRQNAMAARIEKVAGEGLNNGIVIFPGQKHKVDTVARGMVPPGAFQNPLNPSPGTPERLIIIGSCLYSFPGNGSGITHFSYIFVVRGPAGVVYNIRYKGPSIPLNRLVLGRGNVGNSAI